MACGLPPTRALSCRKEMVGPSRSNHNSFGISGGALVGSPLPALVGIVGRFGAFFEDAGDHEFAGLEAAFPGHCGQFVTQ